MTEFTFLITKNDETSKKKVVAENQKKAWAALFKSVDMGTVDRARIVNYQG